MILMRGRNRKNIYLWRFWCSYCCLSFVVGGFITIFSDGMADPASNGGLERDIEQVGLTFPRNYATQIPCM